MYYCKSPCVETPAYGSSTPAFDCVKYNPEGAGMSGWLQVALVIIGVLRSVCLTAFVGFMHYQARNRVLKPPGSSKMIHQT